MTRRRTSRVRINSLLAVLVVLGVVVLLYAVTRPAPTRFLAAALLLGAAGVVRYEARHSDDPGRYGRAVQLRSLYWSVVLVVAFVGVSLLIAHPWTN